MTVVYSPIKKVDIWFDGLNTPLHLGTLVEKDGQIGFQYTLAALASKVEVSPVKYPSTNGSKIYSSFKPYLNGIPGFVYDSLPDGWGMLVQDRFFDQQKISKQSISVLDRLSFIHDTSIGALRYEPGVHAPGSVSALSLKAAYAEIQKALSGTSQEILREFAKAAGSPHGARPKVLLYLNGKGVASSAKTLEFNQPWLYKFKAPTEQFKDACELEYAYNLLAKKAGLDVPDCQLIEIDKKTRAFACRRFDVRDSGQKLHMHSLAGLLEINFREPCLDYSTYFQVVEALTKDKRSLLKAFRQALFNLMFCNQDDHAKNFAFCMSPDKSWDVSPSYDLTYCEGRYGEHFMGWNGKGKHFDFNDILQMTKRFNISNTVLTAMLDDLRGAFADFDNITDIAKVSSGTKSHAKKTIAANFARLKP